MLLTPHTMVGVAIGASISNPLIAVPLSFGMHFLGDLVPHWDFYSHTKLEERIKGWRPVAVMADMALGIAIALTAVFYTLWVKQDPNMALNIFLCGIASVLPDALEAPHIFMQKDTGFSHLLTNIQKKMQFQAPLPWGVFSQILVILASLLVIVGSLGL